MHNVCIFSFNCIKAFGLRVNKGLFKKEEKVLSIYLKAQQMIQVLEAPKQTKFFGIKKLHPHTLLVGM